VKRAGAKRNKIAHWLWGDSPEIPEALLLVDPEAVLLQHVNTKEFAQAIENGDFSLGKPKLDLSKVCVYRNNDFLEIFRELHDPVPLNTPTI